MAKNKDFLVSTADAALRYNGVLVCTAKANLNASIEVSMQEQNVNAGKGNKLIYSYKYGREISVTLEAADWKLEFIACQTGSKIAEGLSDVYKIGECVQITNGIGVLPTMPIGDVAIELSNGNIITVTPTDTTIDLKKYGVENEAVNVTYKYSRLAKSITIDAETSPFVYELIMDADKHNNKTGKVGTIQIIIPSYQPSGNFTMNLTPDAAASTNIDGKALAVEGDTCADGAGVYAYIKEFNDESTTISVTEIAATPAAINLTAVGDTQEISVVGLKGVMYSPIELENSDCTFTSDAPETATVDETGVVTAVAAGSAKISIAYNGIEDEIDVNVEIE